MGKTDDILVSVIIPTYLRDATLERAVRCILAQTHRNLDIIVVDDNLQDSPYRPLVEQIMAKFKADSRIRYIQNEQNLGGAGARNVGIEASRGEYIAFLDDDDEYYPEKIEKQLDVFMNNGSERLALVYCDVEHYNKSGGVDCVIRNRCKGSCLYEASAPDCIAPTSLWLVRKAALREIDGFSVVPCKQDSTVILKLMEKGYELDYVPEVLCKYYNWTGGIRISFGPRKIEGELLFWEACRKNYGKFTKKQVREIEYLFAERLYYLYSGKPSVFKDKIEGARAYMLKLNPYKAGCFMCKYKLKKLKKWAVRRLR